MIPMSATPRIERVLFNVRFHHFGILATTRVSQRVRPRAPNNLMPSDSIDGFTTPHHLRPRGGFSQEVPDCRLLSWVQLGNLGNGEKDEFW